MILVHVTEYTHIHNIYSHNNCIQFFKFIATSLPLFRLHYENKTIKYKRMKKEMACYFIYLYISLCSKYKYVIQLPS